MAQPKRATAKAKGGDEIFRYNGFDVVVPRSILKAWEAQPDKQEQMIMALLAHYAELDRAKREPITEGIRCTLEFGRVPGEPLSKTAEKMANPGVKKAVLELLKYKHYRDWHLSPIRNLFTRAVAMAAGDGDEHFFKALGERLKQKPISYKWPRRLQGLQRLLLSNWLASEGICFCWFSYGALRDFIKRTEGTTHSLDAIKKAVVRSLKLPRLRRSLVRSISQDGKRILLNGAKPAHHTYKPEWWTHDPKMHLSERELTASYKSHRQVPPH